MKQLFLQCGESCCRMLADFWWTFNVLNLRVVTDESRLEAEINKPPSPKGRPGAAKGFRETTCEVCCWLKRWVCFWCFVFQLWVQERMPVAMSTDHGHNLQTVQLLIKKNQVREPFCSQPAASTDQCAEQVFTHVDMHQFSDHIRPHQGFGCQTCQMSDTWGVDVSSQRVFLSLGWVMSSTRQYGCIQKPNVPNSKPSVCRASCSHFLLLFLFPRIIFSIFVEHGAEQSTGTINNQ